jgi:hypothetical protein
MLDLRILQFINSIQEVMTRSNVIKVSPDTFKIEDYDLSNKEAVETISKGLYNLYEQIKEDIGVDWTNLNLETAEALGFMRWSSDEDIDDAIQEIKDSYAENNKVMSYLEGNTMEEKIANVEKTRYLWLLPAYILCLIPEGLHLVSISGKELVYETCPENVSLIKDFRLGVSSWGITFSEEEVENYYKSNKELAEINLT